MRHNGGAGFSYTGIYGDKLVKLRNSERVYSATLH